MEFLAGLVTRARDWAQWNGWRRHGPAVGSVGFHILAGGLLMLSLGAAAGPDVSERRATEAPLTLAIMEVELQPEPMAGVTPPAIARTPSPASANDAPALPDPRKPRGQTAAPSETPATKPDDGAVYIPPSVLIDPGGPPGLRSLMGDDPCATRLGSKSKECIGRELAARTGPMDSVMPRSKEDLKQQFAAFIPDCQWKVGCEPSDDGKLNNGARSVFGTRQHGGAASLGGVHDLVGRLPQKPDFVDPGFGD